MAYVVPIHHPTSVRKALKLRFLDPDEDVLIAAYDQHEQLSSSSVLRYSKAVYGFVTLLEKIKPASSPTEHLFVGTDRYQYFTVSWDASIQQLKTEQSYVDQADKVLRDNKEADRSSIDPTGRFLSLELYDGVVTVVPIVHQLKKAPGAKREPRPMSGEMGSLGDPIQTRIEELSVRGSAFLDDEPGSRKPPRMALLWEDNQDNPQLKIRELSYTPGTSSEPGTADLVPFTELNAELDLGVSHLIPVPLPYGGLLVLGERSITYVDSELGGMVMQPLDADSTIWTCWEKVDDKRWLLADDYGHLFFLMIVTDQEIVTSWRLEKVGDISRASTLVYLEAGFVYVGSHSGDSQVVRIAEQGLELVQTFPNIAPILDLTVMDLGRGAESGQNTEFSSGQARVVTASGAWQDGTLRSVRSGVGMEDLGTVAEISNIIDIWSLSSTIQQEFQDILLVGFVDETRVFKFSFDAEVEELEQFCGLELSEATLLASNLPNFHVLQVYESGIRLADLEGGMVIAEWAPSEGKITAASANDDHLVIVTAGRSVHILATTADLTLLSTKTFPSTEQVASVAVPASNSSVCIVSFWQSSTLCVYNFNSLEQPLFKQTLNTSGSGIPRSILLAQIYPGDAPATLFVAMADGSIITFAFDQVHNSLSGMNQIILGSEPVVFKKIPRGTGIDNVFASCEQPSLIYSSEGRLIYSAVNGDNASRVCHFNSHAYPGALAIASPEELKLASIDTERTTQTQNLPVGETVRSITYSPGLKMFGMGCLRRTLEDGVEGLLSTFKIADEVTFKDLCSYELRQNELLECVISTGSVSEDSSLGHEELFIVGTSVLDESSEAEAVKGRIMVFEVTQEKRLSKMAETEVRGACRCLAMCEGKVVAGLVKTVVVYALTPQPPSNTTFHLQKLTTYRTATNPISLSITQSPTPDPNSKAVLSTQPSIIAVADLMKSLSILTYNSAAPSADGLPTGLPDTLIEVSRHYATVWSSACAAVGENQWLLADMEGNLVVLRRNIAGVTEEDRRRLEVTSEMLLGDTVNTIVPINVSTPNPASVTNGTPGASLVGQAVLPRAFLATTSGAIHLFALIASSFQDILMRLQAAVAPRVQAPGYMPWAKYRAFKTAVREAEEPFRFVDGELVERLLDLDERGKKEVCEELKIGVGEEKWAEMGGSVERIVSMVEGLRRLH
ncbi:MAG: hypothetical protein Q9227_005849 [Pyrenula ochraceoflavens]